MKNIPAMGRCWSVLPSDPANLQLLDDDMYTRLYADESPAGPLQLPCSVAIFQRLVDSIPQRETNMAVRSVLHGIPSGSSSSIVMPCSGSMTQALQQNCMPMMQMFMQYMQNMTSPSQQEPKLQRGVSADDVRS